MDTLQDVRLQHCSGDTIWITQTKSFEKKNRKNFLKISRFSKISKISKFSKFSRFSKIYIFLSFSIFQKRTGIKSFFRHGGDFFHPYSSCEPDYVFIVSGNDLEHSRKCPGARNVDDLGVFPPQKIMIFHDFRASGTLVQKKTHVHAIKKIVAM